jgi:hypothetical protein
VVLALVFVVIFLASSGRVALLVLVPVALAGGLIVFGLRRQRS